MEKGLSNKQKAIMILDELDRVIQIDWNKEEIYTKAIKTALIKIENEEKE